MKIYIKYHNPSCRLESHGNWIDLKSAESLFLNENDFYLISLGVSMKLPIYYQANIVPRSSTFIKYHILQHNHYGVIDGPDKNSEGYSGNHDIWKFGAIALKSTQINVGDRLCQFEIRLSMVAPWYVKIKWIFDNKINFIEVEDLKTKNRGGFGSTNKK